MTAVGTRNSAVRPSDVAPLAASAAVRRLSLPPGGAAGERKRRTLPRSGAVLVEEEQGKRMKESLSPELESESL